MFAEELATAEALATTELLQKLKAEYDCELRKEHASHLSKLRYGSILCCSPSRGLTRRGIELLEELYTHVQHEPLSRQPGIPASGLTSDANNRSRSFDGVVSQSDNTFASAFARQETDMVDGYVFLSSNGLPEDGDFTDQDGDAEDDDDLVSEGARKTAWSADGAHELNIDDDDDDDDDEGEDEDPLTGTSNHPAQMLTRRVSCDSRGGLGLGEESFTESQIPVECLFYIALAHYRLGDYSPALATCDRILDADAACARSEQAHGRALRLRNAAAYARLGRGALGVVVTLGMVVPAILWTRAAAAAHSN